MQFVSIILFVFFLAILMVAKAVYLRYFGELEYKWDVSFRFRNIFLGIISAAAAFYLSYRYACACDLEGCAFWATAFQQHPVRTVGLLFFLAACMAGSLYLKRLVVDAPEDRKTK